MITRILAVTLTLATTAHASLSRDQYLAQLKLADRKVQTQKSRAGQSDALSSSLLRSLFGRYYEVGDQWDVAAWQFDNGMMRMVGDPEMTKIRLGKGGVFHYQVISVKTGADPQVTLLVTQVSAFGLTPPDPKVESLTLTMNDKIVESEKSYQLAGIAAPIAASPTGLHTKVSTLELFPLDVPDVSTAERQTHFILPELPGRSAEIARQIAWHPDVSKSTWFEQDDFFGRPVQILWQAGDPWPAYLKTSNGIAILIRKGTL